MKKAIFIVLGIFLILQSCIKEKADKKAFYYVINHDKKEIKSGDSILAKPPSFKLFYGESNFILLDSTRVFYHDNRDFFGYCITSADETRPAFLGITPDSLTEVKLNDLPVFLKQLKPPLEGYEDKYSVIISSPTDTIKSKAFETISEFFKAKRIDIHYIRNWTEEEKYVVTAKVENKKYDPSKIKWKIGFEEVPFPPTKKEIEDMEKRYK